MNNRNLIEFTKYAERGAYHYNSTIGAKGWRNYSPRVAGRYYTAVKMLNVKKGERVLDAGSGEGVAALLCCKDGAVVHARDLDETACALGEKLAIANGMSDILKFDRGSLYEMPYPDNFFNHVVSLEVIEHMHDVKRYLAELKRVTQPGGSIVISTPMRREDGVLQDPFHVREYDIGSLYDELTEHFSSVEVYSAWRAIWDLLYGPPTKTFLLRRAMRAIIKVAAFYGANVFSGPQKPDPKSSLLICRATKND